MRIKTLDTTLRDGAQAQAISFSVEDKIKIVKLLDELGVEYIEAGNPSSNIKDVEFYKKAIQLSLKNSKLAAFGATRRMNISVSDDENLQRLADAGTPAVVIFGKAWDLHVHDVLHTTEEENISMIVDSIRFLKSLGKEVIFDAEHYFDGFKNNPEYAIKVIKEADSAGADVVCLCDTNGGTFPDEILAITQKAKESVSCEVGIHTHNDTGMAVANSVMSVLGGATHVQGTLNGIGERCGNANLSAIIANLQIKKGYTLIPENKMKSLTAISRAVAEVSNISTSGMPYISKSAFSHKAGMHIDGVLKNSSSFEHVDPKTVGNDRIFLVSEVAGKSAIMPVINKIAPNLSKSSPEIVKILDRLKELEYEGYQFEAAPASFELEIRKVLGIYKPHFDIDKFRLNIEEDREESEGGYATAFVKVLANEEFEIAAAESYNGPVHALDVALRRALVTFYPELSDTHLTDFKVRVLNSESATGAMVRVLIDTTDGEDTWTTIGVSTDIIIASKKALVDSIEYKMLKRDGRQ